MSQRTTQQNRALHKYFALLAATLNAKGKFVSIVIDPQTEWTPDTVKEMLFKPTMRAVLGKTTTTKLTIQEVNDVYMLLDAILKQKYDVDVEFPHTQGEQDA